MPSRGVYAKGAARREEILATALRVVAEKGYTSTSLRGIGRELGVEPAHILHYFGSREELLCEVVERWDRGSLDVAGPQADALAVYSAALRHNLSIRGIVQLYLAFAAEAADESHAAHAYFRDRFAVSVRELAAAIDCGRQAGQIRPAVEPERTARMLIALADGLQLQSLMDPAVDAPAEFDAAMDELFVTGTREPIDRPARRTAG